MAKVTYTVAMEEHYLSDFYSGIFELSVADSGKKATFTDGESGARIQGFGQNLDGDADGLTGGTFDKLVFSAEGETLVTVLGDFSAKALFQATKNNDFLELQRKIFSGDDDFQGSSKLEAIYGFGGDDEINAAGGNDLVNGGKGKDSIRGGGGFDTFVFNLGDGRDVIKDFNVGDAEDHERLQISAEFDIVKNKHGDAVIVLSDDDRLTLDGVSKSQLEDYHFSSPE